LYLIIKILYATYYRPFIGYVTVDAESDPNSETTQVQQNNFSSLVEELKKIGMQVTIDD
jgi:tripeptide aminopeptidase